MGESRERVLENNVFEGFNEEDMGQNNNTTLPFRPSTNLDFLTPSLAANAPSSFDICFPPS